jgi:hypothetical protein
MVVTLDHRPAPPGAQRLQANPRAVVHVAAADIECVVVGPGHRLLLFPLGGYSGHNGPHRREHTMTNSDDTAHIWRDLADQLTPVQVTTLDRIEADLLARGAPADKVAAALLDHARYHAQRNLDDTAMFGHLPTPAVTRFLNHFEENSTGNWLRRFDGAIRDVDDCRVEVIGIQHGDGTISRAVCVNGEELTSGQARELAKALVAAANEADQHG